MSDEKKPLGKILLQQRALTQAELEAALASSKASGSTLASKLVEEGRISEIDALKALSEQVGVPGIDIGQVCIRLGDLAILPREVATRHELLPVLAKDDRIFVAMVHPDDKRVIDELEFVTGKRVFPYIALAGPLRKTIHDAYDLLAQGKSFYVGPRCPPEVRRKAGVDESPAAPEARAPSPPAPPSPSPARTPPAPEILAAPPPRIVQPPVPSQAAARSAVVVDSALERDERGLLHEDDSSFGDLSRELSVVAELPKQPGREAAPEPRVEAHPAQPAAAGPAPHSKTVLVVDDEPDIRKLLRRVFEERGYRVLDADRGLAALRIVKETPPDIIVLDAMLPEMHGFELARRLKGSQRYGRIPIIMVSAVYKGWRIAEDVKTSYGVDAYIEKPFKISDVLGAVEQAIVKAETVSEASSDPDAISAEAERLLEAGIAAYRAGDVQGAIASLVAGTKIDPLAYRLHLHLGLLYGKEGQVYEAISELETALNINSQHFPALKNLAVLYQKAGFRNKAVEMWERALKHAPDDPTRAQIKQHLVSLL